MTTTKSILTGLLCACVVGGSGCKHCCHRGVRGSPARVPAPPGATFLEAPAPVAGGATRIPPPDLPTAPAPAMDPGPSGPGPVPSAPPPSIPDSAPPRGTLRIDPAFPPPASTPSPKPRAPEILFPDTLGAPEAVAALPPKSRTETRGYLGEPVKPMPPEKPAPAPPTDTPAPPATISEEPRPAPPAATSEPPATFDPSLLSRKAGLPGLSPVSDVPNVFAGRRPALEGFDTLKAAGVRAVVYLHAPGADLAPARDLAERRGLRFVAVEASPQNLEAALRDFTAAVTDAANRPLYAFDDTGSRSGILWYLFFRTADRLGDDAARVRANPLGLRDAAADELQPYWLAAQAILEKRS